MELEFFEFDDDDTMTGSEKSKEEEQQLQWRSDDDDEEEDAATDVEATRAFWDSQHHLLRDALSRRTSTEARIQRATEDAVRDQARSKATTGGEVCCVLRSIADRLRQTGHNSAVCKAKWRSSPGAPSGEHSYIDVVVESKKKNRKKGPTRVLIEPNFRAEFEMARASSEYNKLVCSLPEVFVSKAERLRAVIKVMCGAAKRCMKDNRMHMAPWRKHKYMQSKWLGTCERIAPGLSLSPPASENPRPARPRASMLTFDLHCTAVEVV